MFIIPSPVCWASAKVRAFSVSASSWLCSAITPAPQQLARSRVTRSIPSRSATRASAFAAPQASPAAGTRHRYVVLVLAEGMHIDIADQLDLDGGGFAVDLLIDRCDIRRRRHLGVGEIEIERGVELQRELLVVEHRRNVDAARHFEHEADEGRLHRCTDANRRLFFAAADRALQRNARSAARARSASSRITSAGRLGGGPVQPSGKRSTKIRSPAVMVLTLTRRANDSRIAEPSGSRRAEADIVGHRVGQFVDRNIHRALEADHDDRAGGDDLGLDVLGELEHQPCVAAAEETSLRP